MPIIDDITIGRYQSRDSMIHALDPRTKGISTLLLMVSTFGISSFIGLGSGLLISLGLIALAKIESSDFRRNLRAFSWLFLFTFLLHLFFTPSDEKFLIPLINAGVSKEGMILGLYYCGRIGLLLSFSYIFMAVTSPMEITDGIERTLRPFKKIGLPVYDIALAISIALRFVPTLLDEARRIRDAQLCRGARLEGNVILKIQGFSAMLIPLFASALRRADALALALEARGYKNSEKRTSFIRLKFKRIDGWALLLMLILTITLIML